MQKICTRIYLETGADPGPGAIVPHKTYESNFIHHNFVQFGKQHSPYKAILSSTILSQQFCKVYEVPHLSYSSLPKLLADLTTKYYWNRPP